MHDPLQRLYRTKLVLLATLLIVIGVALLFFGHFVQRDSGTLWLRSWPIVDIGSALFTTGLLGVALQYFDGQDSEERATKRLERVITNATPAMRDAVIDGFAFNPDDLARVATPEVLDQIVTNGLGIRLGEVYSLHDHLRMVMGAVAILIKTQCGNVHRQVLKRRRAGVLGTASSARIAARLRSFP